MLEAEMDTHLGYQKHEVENKQPLTVVTERVRSAEAGRTRHVDR
jgi:hypothetical protein